jgi:hypothetical protein
MEMEEMNALLRQTNSEVDESIAALNSAYNKIKAVKEVLVPDLMSITKEILNARMTTERELATTLKWLKTVREFFLEKDYENEMSRIREFVVLCNQVQALKEAGLLDAVADLAIKLATQEVKS